MLGPSCCTQYDMASSRSEITFDISMILDIMIRMKPIEVFKALSNESRLEILQWLKEPEQYFTPHEGIDMREIGVCVSQVTEKLNMTQSTASQYLSILHRAGLIKTERLGKFTYYKRDEEVIREIGEYLKQEI
jgi:DNA-binding transcriptional ArsR family regulator